MIKHIHQAFRVFTDDNQVDRRLLASLRGNLEGVKIFKMIEHSNNSCINTNGDDWSDIRVQVELLAKGNNG